MPQPKAPTYLSRDAIIGAVDVEYRDVPTPEWGGTVRLRGLTVGQYERFQQSVVKQKGKDTTVNHRNMRAKLLALCIVDADGNRIFTNDDLDALSGKSARVIERLFDVAQEMVGIGDNEVEEMTEGFDDGQSDDSFSA